MREDVHEEGDVCNVCSMWWSSPRGCWISTSVISCLTTPTTLQTNSGGSALEKIWSTTVLSNKGALPTLTWMAWYQVTRTRGWQESDEELGLVMGELRVLSLDFVQAQALWLLTRWTYLGDGASSAAQRREQVTWQEEERRRVQRAHYEAHIRGRGVPRAGEIFSLD